MGRNTRPMFARRCTKVWTPADERSFQRSLSVLKLHIRASGGLDRWVNDGGIEEWLAPEPDCPVLLHHR